MLSFEAGLLLLLQLAVVALALFGLVDCARRPAEGFAAAGKLSKPAWAAILAGSAFFVFFFGVLGIFGAVGAVASIVYLVDVRPALQGLRGPWY